jgi:tetratricopeptide (TPR) repeat protein
MDGPNRKQAAVWIAVGLAAATCVVYAPLRHHDFIQYDDPAYVTENPRVREGLSLDNVAWAFTTGHASNWHPLTWLSHMLDAQLFGLEPGPHHLSSLALHAVNAVLLFWVLMQMSGACWRPAFVAAMFALHPLHVESVAWIAERKDVLSGFFWMLTLLAWHAHLRQPAAGRYALALALFACGLMSKPMTITLPVVLLLLDHWPLRRIEWPARGEWTAYRRRLWRLSAEKIPFFILSAVSGVITLAVQHRAGSVGPMEVYPPGARLGNALLAYVRYLGKTFWPQNLAVFYPYPVEFPLGQALMAGAALAAITWLVARSARQRPWLPAGWLWYLGTLVPVIGLVQVGSQSMADRYTYLPLTGIFIIVAWGATEVVRRRNLPSPLLAAAAAMLVAASALVTRAQLRHWENTGTLFTHALRVTRQNNVAHANLGMWRMNRDELDQAVFHFAEAVRIQPKDVQAQNNLGVALFSRGELDAARARFEIALGLQPDYADALSNLGLVLLTAQRPADAIPRFEQALRLQPDLASAHTGLGLALAGLSRNQTAIHHLRRACALRPDDALAHYHLAVLLTDAGQPEEAIQHLRHAARLNPRAPEAHEQLARLLHQRDRPAEAIPHYRLWLQLEADRQRHPEILDALAAALAGAAEPELAIAAAEQALQLAADTRQPDLARQIRQRLELYRSRVAQPQPAP